MDKIEFTKYKKALIEVGGTCPIIHSGRYKIPNFKRNGTVFKGGSMSMLTFFPWMTIKEKKILGDYELIPYNLRNTSTTKIDTEIKRLLSSYYIHNTCPVSSITILKIKTKGIFDDLSQDERNDIFRLMEVISFYRLSMREYFFHSDKYTNHDSSQVIVQGFKEGESGVVITSRRRDGTMSNYSSDEFFKILKPHHIISASGVKLEDAFFESLIDISLTEDWDELQSPVFSFLKANTDNNDISEHSEMIFMAGAFEKILESQSNAASVANNFNKLISQFIQESSDIKCSDRILNRPKLKELSSIREVWMRDFYAARSMLAHGSKSVRGVSIWSTFEHLLLASHIFPILFKLKLHLKGSYVLTEDDLAEIFYFDNRIRFGDVFKIGEDKYSMPIFGWNESTKQARWDWLYNKESLLMLKEK